MIISKRHKKPAFRTRVVRRIEQIPREDWNSVYPGVLEGYDFFKTLDESNLEQFSLHYVIVYDRKTPVGATTFFTMSYSLDTSINGPLRRISNRIKKILPNIFSLKVVICGMPMGQGRIGAAEGYAERVTRAILHKMERMAKKKKAPIVAFKDFDRIYTSLIDPLQKEGFTKFDSLPSTELNVWFKDFEEYLNTLSSANRYDLRRKFRRVKNQPPVEMTMADSIEGPVLDEVYKLYLNILNKHDMGFEILPLEFFRNISKNMPGRAKYFLWRVEGRLAAFLLALVSRDEFIDYYVGLDYSVAHKYHLYFIKFRETLNWCIAKGIKRYEMGVTGYEPKRRLGFNFIPLYIYVKLRNRMMRPAFNFICQFLKFENFDPALKKAMNVKKG